MKKILLAAAALISATAVQAESSSFAGFYAGVHGGVNQLNTKVGFTGGTFDLGKDLGKASGFLGLHAGYGMLASSNVYLGLEAYFGFSGAKVKDFIKDGNDEVSVELKKKSFYGVAARAGYLFNSTSMIYARLGLEGGKYEAKFTTKVGTASIDAKASKNTIRPVLGGGLEFAVASNVLLGAEYNYVVGPKVAGTTRLGTSTYNLKVNTSEHRFGVRLSYKF